MAFDYSQYMQVVCKNKPMYITEYKYFLSIPGLPWRYTVISPALLAQLFPFNFEMTVCSNRTHNTTLKTPVDEIGPFEIDLDKNIKI